MKFTYNQDPTSQCKIESFFRKVCFVLKKDKKLTQNNQVTEVNNIYPIHMP